MTDPPLTVRDTLHPRGFEIRDSTGRAFVRARKRFAHPGYRVTRLFVPDDLSGAGLGTALYTQARIEAESRGTFLLPGHSGNKRIMAIRKKVFAT